MFVFWITLLIAVLFAALFVLALSITRLRKGRDLESDVGSNRHMRERGIECTSAQIRREEAERLGKSLPENCSDDCGGCGKGCSN